ncbi:hypothetical protein CAPTEDRAFT_224352 [Capitella teleta]|uniref:Signal recognition particle receptor subunit beta n=1 Tax=Capitella teleta TaxID=283909 RepID=R7TFD1_CAPTE|nr:hypothetical protein CAPTEDRAFT_224352 [Capitella teleta]|eukprot:ELT89726.1 hypothetical protein CAPTEDRAFT_224352 [Capitella teleta]
MESLTRLAETVRSGVVEGDTTVIAVLVSIFIVILTTVTLIVRSLYSHKRTGILLVGLCDAGKTLIFSRLVSKRFVQTHTTIKQNSGVYSLRGEKSGKCLHILDLPGHERLRYQCLDQTKSLARGIVFVIDSLMFQRELKDVAEFLYVLLTDSVLAQHAPPILIACNKTDQALAKGSKVIQVQLEKEMNTLRMTKSAALSDSVGNSNTYLGKRGKDFSFADLKPFKVEFIECSARGSKDESLADLKGIEQWLLRLA